MSKDNRTINDLFDNVQGDYAWRIKELSDYRNTLLASKMNVQTSLIRGGIILLYAHWEGFIKVASEHYYNFVLLRGLLNSELKENFLAISLRKYINAVIESKKITIQTEGMKFINSKMLERANMPSELPMKTSNMKYDMFIEYCELLGIDKTKFELKKIFIDYQLVKNRHIIAHGNYLLVDLNNFEEIYKKTLELIAQVKIEILNSATLQNYKL